MAKLALAVFCCKIQVAHDLDGALWQYVFTMAVECHVMGKGENTMRNRQLPICYKYGVVLV